MQLPQNSIRLIDGAQHQRATTASNGSALPNSSAVSLVTVTGTGAVAAALRATSARVALGLDGDHLGHRRG